MIIMLICDDRLRCSSVLNDIITGTVCGCICPSAILKLKRWLWWIEACHAMRIVGDITTVMLGFVKLARASPVSSNAERVQLPYVETGLGSHDAQLFGGMLRHVLNYFSSGLIISNLLRGRLSPLTCTHLLPMLRLLRPLLQGKTPNQNHREE